MKKYTLENVSPNKKSFQTEKMKVPAILFSHERDFSKSDVLEALEKIAQQDEIFHHIAILSEAHTRPEIKNPTGSVVTSENILPEMFDAAPNCGMRIILTDIMEEEMTQEKLNNLLQNIQKNILSKELIGTKISSSMVCKIFQEGARGLFSDFPIKTKNEIENTLFQGNFFQKKIASITEISKAIPKIIFYLAKYRIGLLGEKKSHFIKLMRVSSIENKEIAEKLGIRNNQYLFFMHTGSSIIGRYTASLYTQRKITKISQKIILSIIKIISGFSLQKKSIQDMDIALRAVSNYGFANRTLLTCEIHKALEKIFARTVSTELLYDAPHVYFEEESHFGKKVIVHRNGANRAFGPSKMTHHAVFSQTGEPVLIAPFANKIAYVGVGTDQNEETFFSANHEIGKIKELQISEEKSLEYAEKIVSEMGRNQIIKLVAKLETIKILDY